MSKKLIEEVRQDPTYKTFIRILESTKKSLNFEKLHEEVRGLHLSRTSRTLYGDKRYSIKALQDANANDMSARSRMAEIMATTDIKLGKLSNAVSAMRKHIVISYGDDLKEEGYSGPVAKKMFADRVMKQALMYLGEGETLLKMITIYLKDIDQAGHSLHRMNELVKLVTEGRGKVL